jgi:hypothetical protein
LGKRVGGVEDKDGVFVNDCVLTIDQAAAHNGRRVSDRVELLKQSVEPILDERHLPSRQPLESAPRLPLFCFRRLKRCGPESGGSAFGRCRCLPARCARHRIGAAQPHAEKRILFEPWISHFDLSIE